MSWSIDPRLDTPANAAVLAFLRREQPSAHSDVAESLILSARGIADLRSWCPDPQRYAFVALCRADERIVGLAWGQSALAYRLDPAALEEAIREGARHTPQLGAGWAWFDPWPVDEPRAETARRLARWCARAAATD